MAKTTDIEVNDVRSTPTLVDWDEHGDPSKPTNWSRSKKWSNVVLISLLTFISPFGSSMLAPSMPEVMEEFGSTNLDLQALAVSIYVLGYAFGPLAHGPMSEVHGRLPLYLVNCGLFIVANIACGLSTSLPMLIVFRLVAGLVGSCPLSNGPASLSDMFEQHERGKAMAVWNLPILVGPAIGPLVGSYLTAAGGWRWNCWFLAIGMGILWIASFAILRESYAPATLERKAAKLRKQHGNQAFVSALGSSTSNTQKMLTALVRPMKLLLFSPIVTALSFLSAVTYGYIYLLFTSMTLAFSTRYGFKNTDVGLMYLGFGIGNIVGNVFLGLVADKLMRKMAGGGALKPEYRLPPLLPASLLLPIGLFIYGWTLEYNIHWMVPEFGLFIIGTGTILISAPINVYLIDAFSKHAASASAANTVLRSLGGSLLPLCGGRMYEALGDGWGNSVLAFVGIGFIPVIWYTYKNGEKLRKGGIVL